MDTLQFDIYRTGDIHRFSELTEFVMDIIDIPNDRSKEYYHNRDFVRNLLANLIISKEYSVYIRYSRDIKQWSINSRYYKLYLKYPIMCRIIDLFLEYGFIEQIKGYYDRETKRGYITRMRPTSKFTAILNDFDMTDIKYLSKDNPDEVIWLRDKSKTAILYKDTRRIKRMRADLIKYNDFIAEQKVEIRCDNPFNMKIEKFDMLIIYSMKGILQNISYNIININKANSNSNNSSRYSSNSSSSSKCSNYNTTHKISLSHLYLSLDYLHLQRIFSAEKFSLGGRFYGSVHQIFGGEIRKHIFINGEPTIELDYSAMHIRMLYHLINREYTGDPYMALCDHPDDRPYLKKVSMVLINCPRDKKVVWAIKGAIEKDNKLKPISNSKIQEYINRFTKHHPDIARFLQSGIGLKLQNMDSNIMNSIMKGCVKQGIPILPVHDSAIVQSEYRDILYALMVEEYEKVMGFKPKIK